MEMIPGFSIAQAVSLPITSFERRMAKTKRSAKNKRISASNPLKKEFLQLFESSGWSQAEVARQLELTRGGVNGIITGPTVPSLATVKLFQLILASKAPVRANSPGVSSVEEWAKPLLEELKKIEPSQRSHLVAALCEVVRSARNGTALRGRVPRTD